MRIVMRKTKMADPWRSSPCLMHNKFLASLQNFREKSKDLSFVTANCWLPQTWFSCAIAQKLLDCFQKSGSSETNWQQAVLPFRRIVWSSSSASKTGIHEASHQLLLHVLRLHRDCICYGEVACWVWRFVLRAYFPFSTFQSLRWQKRGITT